jgi:hypothetical protein
MWWGGGFWGKMFLEYQKKRRIILGYVMIGPSSLGDVLEVLEHWRC